jgi:hypothetical protein
MALDRSVEIQAHLRLPQTTSVHSRVFGRGLPTADTRAVSNESHMAAGLSCDVANCETARIGRIDGRQAGKRYDLLVSWE